MLAKLLSSQLRRNAASGILAASCNAAAAFISYPVYVNYLGLEVYGIWVVLGAIMQCALLGDLGISQATTKLVSEEQGRGNRDAVQAIITASMYLLGIVGATLVGLTWQTTDTLAFLFGLTAEHAEIACKYIPLVSAVTVYVILGRICCSALSGIGRMDLANYVQTFGRCLAVATSWVLLAGGWGLASLLFGVIVNCVVVHLSSILLFRKKFGRGMLLLQLPQRHFLKRILRFGGGVTGASLFTLALNPFNKLILCRFSGVASVPIYEIAFNGAKQIKTLTEASLRAIVPEVSRLAANGLSDNSQEISRLNKRALRMVVCFSLPGYAIALLIIEPLVTFWVGSSLATPLAPVMSVMLLGSFISLLSVPSYYTLLGIGQVRTILVASVIKVATNALVCLTFLGTGMAVSPLSLSFAVLAAMSLTTFYLTTERWRCFETSSRKIARI